MCNKHTFQALMVRAALLIHCLISGPGRRIPHEDAVTCITKGNKLRQKAACGEQHAVLLPSPSFLPKSVCFDQITFSYGIKAPRYGNGWFEGGPMHLLGYFADLFVNIRALAACWQDEEQPEYMCKHRWVNSPSPCKNCNKEKNGTKNKCPPYSHCFWFMWDTGGPQAKDTAHSRARVHSADRRLAVLTADREGSMCCLSLSLVDLKQDSLEMWVSVLHLWLTFCCQHIVSLAGMLWDEYTPNLL